MLVTMLALAAGTSGEPVDTGLHDTGGDSGVEDTGLSPVQWRQGIVPFVTLEGRGNHACGITAEGAIHCWGNDHYGQLQAPTGPVVPSTRPSPT